MSDKTKINETIAELGLTMTTEFIPWSKSRNAGEKEPSLNWKVTILRNGRAFLTTDYMQGKGHCLAQQVPMSMFGGQNSVLRDDAVRLECETGKESHALANGQIISGKAISGPDITDVLYSLVTDSDVIEHPTYEDWAENFGYDPDSRKGEAIYRACLETALKMRNAIGEDGLAKLRDAFQDY